MVPVNERDYAIKFNVLQLGLLTGLIMQADERTQQYLKSVWDQLGALKKQFEQDAGVKKEVLPGGLIRSTDKDGYVITRPPMPWEVEGN